MAYAKSEDRPEKKISIDPARLKELALRKGMSNGQSVTPKPPVLKAGS